MEQISEIMTQPRNNNLDCLIDPAFRNINRCVERRSKKSQNFNRIYYIKTMETYCVSCKKYNADENSSVRKTK